MEWSRRNQKMRPHNSKDLGASGIGFIGLLGLLWVIFLVGAVPTFAADSTFTFGVDNTPPVTTADPPEGTYDFAPLVTLSCDDGSGSGCSATTYCTGANCSPATTYTGPIRISGSTILRFRSTDNGANLEGIVTKTYVKGATQPKTITVPATRSTIQAAIDAAYAGDTILVSPGTYQENINFYGKNITVTSSNGAEVTVIDGNRAGTVVTFNSGESSSALNGFSLRNGLNNNGAGGVNVFGSSPTITNNRIFDNSGSTGGGIGINSGSPSLSANQIFSNSAGYGGGVYVTGAGSAVISNNTISGNRATTQGGGVLVGSGGTHLVAGNIIKANVSANEGGGLYLAGNDTRVVQNVIADNQAFTGGAVHAAAANVSFINNTITNNSSSQTADVYVPTAPFVNNIVMGGTRTAAVYRESSSLANFNNNVVYSPSGNAPYSGCPDQNGKSGNITSDPKLHGFFAGYYGLQADSPAVDAGSASAVTSLPTTDLAGMARVLDGNNDGIAAIDIGAYEFDPSLPAASVQGAPTDFLTTASVTLTVGGSGVSSYRYALDGGDFSGSDIPKTVPITLANLANGRHALAVLGKSADGKEQQRASATVLLFVVNTETSDLTFTNGGNAPWFVQPLVTRDGIAYQSGQISQGQTSWLQTTITGPGALRFWWKVSSLYSYNPLSLSIDGVTQSSISDEVDWQFKVYQIPTGSHTLRWTYLATAPPSPTLSNAGWVDQIAFSPGSNPDILAPVTRATPGSGLYAGTQSVALSCNDGGGSGCAGTLYCIGSGCTPLTAYSAPLSLSSPTTVSFYSTDSAGNFETIKTETYSFDTTPPTTQVSLPAGTYSGGRNLALSCTDVGLGCAATYFCLGNGCTPTTPYTAPIAITASTVIRFYSVDLGGNGEKVQSATFIITPDLTPPTTTTSRTSGTYRPFGLSLYCYDSQGSGCATTYYCLGDGCTPTIPYTSAISLSTSTIVRFYSKDLSDNAEPVVTRSYTIDGDAPVTTASIPGGIYTGTTQVTLSCSDGTGSGCSSTYYCTGVNCSPGTLYAGPISLTTSTVLRYFSNDRAGNGEAIKGGRYTILLAPPATIRVPSDRATIQGAIDNAKDGDVIVVAPGTYPERIDFKGKAITVTSSAGAAVTTIDGNRGGPVVTFDSNEWGTSVLDGFTIQNGGEGTPSGYYGGGISVVNADPVIRNNRVTGNTGCIGIGIYVYNGSPLIQGNDISNNIQSACSIGEGGGGIYLGWSTGAKILDNTITGNKVSIDSGGGIFSYYSHNTLIQGNTIRNNSCAYYGGGIATINSHDSQIVGNLIAGNTAQTGGGIYLWEGNSGVALVNNTVVANDASQGGAIFTGVSADMALITNNIIAAKGGQNALWCNDFYGNAPPKLKNNLVFSPRGSAFGGICSGQNGQNGNVTQEPKLSGADFGYFGPAPDSPVIDAGDNSAPSLGATDLQGTPRILAAVPQATPVVDIGAYEYDPGAPRVTLSGAPTGATKLRSASLAVSGSAIVSYRYALDGEAFTLGDIPVATPILLSGLAGGVHAVAVIGKTSLREQPVSAATVAQWTIDTSAPVTTASPGGGPYTSPQTVTLSCDDGNGGGCATTYYCLGGGCTPTTPYSGPIPIGATAGLSFYSVDAFGNAEGVKSASYVYLSSILGQITDGGTQTGLAQATVTVYNAATGYQVASGTSDSSGNYQIPGLPNGAYKVSFHADGYLTQWYRGKVDMTSGIPVTVSAPSPTNGIDAALVKGGEMSGVVTGVDTGLPLQGIQVNAYDAVTGAQVASATTTGTGAYSITGLAGGGYRVKAAGSSGYLDRWYLNQTASTATLVSVSAAAKVTGIDLALPKGGSISGTVTDGSGAGLAGVFVTVIDSGSGSQQASATTDATGAYTITGLGGQYNVQFAKPSYVSAWYKASGATGQKTTVSVSAPATTGGVDAILIRGASITGRVADHDTAIAILNVNVRVLDATSTSGEWVASATTDQYGNYSITGLSGGSYKIKFSAAGYVEQWSGATGSEATAVAVSVTAAQTISGYNVRLSKGGSISGTVTEKGTGHLLQNINVYAVDPVTGAQKGAGCTDGSGAFIVTGLAGGNYRVRFVSNNGSYLETWYNQTSNSTPAAVRVPTLGALTGINVSLEGAGSITGTVTDRRTGAPIPGTTVYAQTPSGRSYGYATADDSGKFRLAPLASGSYQLTFSAPGFLNNTGTASVAAPNTTTGADAQLDKGGSVFGMVSDGITGVGIPSVAIRLDDGTGSYGDAVTGNDGTFTVTGLKSGSYRMKVTPPLTSGYIAKELTAGDDACAAGPVLVTAPETTTGISIRLDQGASLSGRVIGSSSSAVFGARVYALTGNGTLSNSPNASTDVTGSFTLGGLPGGDYQITVQAPGYLPATSRVTVTAPDAVTLADTSLVQGGSVSGRVTDQGSGEGVLGIEVDVIDLSTGNVTGYDTTSDGGDYLVTGLPSGSYGLSYRLAAASADARPWSAHHDPIAVTSPATTAGVDFTIEPMGAISGHVRDGGNEEPLESVSVQAIQSSTGRVAGSTMSTSDGSYRIEGLTSGSYQIGFSTPSSFKPGYLGRWYGVGATGSQVSVLAPETTFGVDVEMSKAGGISGTVHLGACSPAADSFDVVLYDPQTEQTIGPGVLIADYSGNFTLSGVPAGSYKLSVVPKGAGFARKWYSNKNNSAGADTVTVTAGSITGGIDLTLSTTAGKISGSFAGASCKLKLYDWYSGGLVTDGNALGGTYSLGGLPDGTYKLLFNLNGANGWYRRQGDTAAASQITVSGGGALTGIDLFQTLPNGALDGGAPKVIDALRALRVAVGLDPATPEILAHYDVAPVVDGVTIPDGAIDISDALTILKRAVALPSLTGE